MPHLIKAIDYKTRETQLFTIDLNPMLCFKVNAEQKINAQTNSSSKGRRWTVLEMQPLLISAPF
jgi:hypothetical protein